MPSWPSTSLPMSPLVGTLEVTPEPNIVEFKPDVFTNFIRGKRYTAKANVYNGVLLLQGLTEKDALENFFHNDCEDGALPFDMLDWIDGSLQFFTWIAAPTYTHLVFENYRASVQILKMPLSFSTGTGT